MDYPRQRIVLPRPQPARTDTTTPARPIHFTTLVLFLFIITTRLLFFFFLTVVVMYPALAVMSNARARLQPYSPGFPIPTTHPVK
jgi:hypothetical protein